MFNLFTSTTENKKESEKITLVKEILNELDYLYDDLNDLDMSKRNERKCIRIDCEETVKFDSLLRRYKLSKISNDYKLSSEEDNICYLLDYVFSGLEKRTSLVKKIEMYLTDDKKLIRYSDELIFMYCLIDNTVNINLDTIKQVFKNYEYSKIDLELVCIDWISDIYNLKITKNIPFMDMI